MITGESGEEETICQSCREDVQYPWFWYDDQEIDDITQEEPFEDTSMNGPLSDEVQQQRFDRLNAFLRAQPAAEITTYTVSHFAKALVSDEDKDKLTEFLEEQGVPNGDPDMTIYNVEFAEIDITEAHFTVLKSGELSLNELCSELFSDCEPDWATNGETFGVFEESETRLGDMTVLYNQKF